MGITNGVFVRVGIGKRLQGFCSLLPDPMAWQADSFLIPWDHLDVYAFPLFTLIRKVTNRVLISPGLKMTRVALCQPQAEWFPGRLGLLVDSPRVISHWQILLRQSHFRWYHRHVKALNLHAWRLSNVSTEWKAFSQDCQRDALLHSKSSCDVYQGKWLRFCRWGVEGNSFLPMPLFHRSQIS